MTKDEFVKQYCINSEVSKEIFDKHFVALPCRCGEDNCNGWAAVNNNDLAIKSHNDLYSNEEIPLIKDGKTIGECKIFKDGTGHAKITDPEAQVDLREMLMGKGDAICSVRDTVPRTPEDEDDARDMINKGFGDK